LNPDILVWARESSKLDHDTVAKRVGVRRARLEAWEHGAAFPTLTQLRKLANVYRRSVGVFFLPERPADQPQPADYRRIELSVPHVMSPELATGIRAAESKREAALDIYTQSEEEPPQFGLQLDPDLPAEEMARHVSEQLGISMRERQEWAN